MSFGVRGIEGPTGRGGAAFVGASRPLATRGSATLWRDAPEPNPAGTATVVQRELANADRSGRPRLLELFGGIPTVRPAQLQLADQILDSSPCRLS